MLAAGVVEQASGAEGTIAERLDVIFDADDTNTALAKIV